MYAKLEEDFGLARRAMSIFDRATQVVADEDKFEVCLTHNTCQRLYVYVCRCSPFTLRKQPLTMGCLRLGQFTNAHWRVRCDQV